MAVILSAGKAAADGSQAVFYSEEDFWATEGRKVLCKGLLAPLAAGAFSLGKTISRAPAPAKPLSHSLFSPIGGEKSPKGDSLYGSPPWRYFSVQKSNQKSFSAAP